MRQDPTPGLSATHVGPEPGQPTLCGKDGRGREDLPWARSRPRRGVVHLRSLAATMHPLRRRASRYSPMGLHAFDPQSLPGSRRDAHLNLSASLRRR